MGSPADGTHMIVLPGGGYAAHAPHEAEPVATWTTLAKAWINEQTAPPG